MVTPTAMLIRPLTADEAAYAAQDRLWRAATAELEDLPPCGHFFRYHQGCRRCELNLTIDRAENALARLAGHEAPNSDRGYDGGCS